MSGAVTAASTGTIAFFTIENIAYATFGAALLWCKSKETLNSAYGFGRIWELIGLKGKKKDVAEFLGFMIAGLALGIGLTQPVTAFQAFTAGLGWTALASAPSKKAPTGGGSQTGGGSDAPNPGGRKNPPGNPPKTSKDKRQRNRGKR